MGYMNDTELSDWLKKRYRAKKIVCIAHYGWLCKVAVLGENTPTLITADPERKSLTQLKKLAKAGLLQHVEADGLQSLEETPEYKEKWKCTNFSEADAERFIQKRQEALGKPVYGKKGRGKEVSPKTAWRVWAEAGGCCMYEGCAADLSGISLHTKAAKIGYLAHIIASSPNGPRGDSESSVELSDDPENIMLMCDEHHRLIDSYAPSEHPKERLQDMRRHHLEKMKALRKAMSYPVAQAVPLLANLAGVPTYFRDTQFQEALLAEKYAMAPRVEYLLRRTAQRDDRSNPGFWYHYLHEHENDIRRFVGFVKEVFEEEGRTLGIFPLHHVAMLVLAGRIVGEASPVEVFQYDRQQETWCWHYDVQPHPEGIFKIIGLEQEQTKEALLSVELTAPINESVLPDTLIEMIDAKTLPWIRIQTENPNPNIIRRAEDLQQFRTVCRRAINHIQDKLRVEKVHLVVVSPASTAFMLGQLLQAGNHPPYVVYDRANFHTPFSPALTINGQTVSATTQGDTFTINIR
jgi:hypothetical protein